MAATRELRVNSRGRPGIDDLAVTHDHDPVRGVEDLAQQMGDEDAGAARLPRSRRTKARSWPATTASSEEVGSSRMTSLQRLLRHGEGPGDLDHLAPRDGKVADDGAGGDAMAGKDLVELARDQRAGLAPPAETGRGPDA